MHDKKRKVCVAHFPCKRHDDDDGMNTHLLPTSAAPAAAAVAAHPADASAGLPLLLLLLRREAIGSEREISKDQVNMNHE